MGAPERQLLRLHILTHLVKQCCQHRHYQHGQHVIVRPKTPDASTFHGKDLLQFYTASIYVQCQVSRPSYWHVINARVCLLSRLQHQIFLPRHRQHLVL